MVTSVSCCGAECGAFGGGAHFTQASGTASFSTTTIRTGARSIRSNPTAGITTFQNQDLPSSLTHVGRCYVRFATLPDADTSIIHYGSTGSPASACGVRFKVSDSSLYAAVGTTFGASGVAVTTGQWYRIDFKFVCVAAGNDTTDVQIDGTVCGQATAAGDGAATTTIKYGNLETATCDIYWDDFLWSITGGDYPLGAGYVRSYVPNADGAHNVAGANDFERSATGTDITNATTDAYTLIDDRPIKSGTIAEYINGIAPPNSTDYVEWQYEDSVESDPPRAVEAILTLSDAATAGANACTITLREHAGATSGNIFSGDTAAASAGAAVFKRAQFATVPGTADAWTTTKFNALRSRFLVSDAAPDPWVGSAMLEAEFPPAVAAESSKYWRRTGNVPGMRPDKGHAPTWGRTW